ncbi:hypothetical protein M8009_18170 [Halomonas sp. ATCH28]|uniref:CENP-V/GFA domain-containing protein n=1 Tax=Halomonas gemina TaxID=2945105 RepID=A0ABT0T652_9GAMM|nr:hypothetical protein [Halomonas gemina]MCL7942209.1 hypothetical protein [Halomonas gemina]
MLLEGSCHCGAVHFRVDSPHPYQRCYCSICRKTARVEVEARDNDRCFAGYPEESLAEWHWRLGLVR